MVYVLYSSWWTENPFVAMTTPCTCVGMASTKSLSLTAIFFFSLFPPCKSKESLPFSLSHVMILESGTGYDRNRVFGAAISGMAVAWHFPSYRRHPDQWQITQLHSGQLLRFDFQCHHEPLLTNPEKVTHILLQTSNRPESNLFLIDVE